MIRRQPMPAAHRLTTPVGFSTDEIIPPFDATGAPCAAPGVDPNAWFPRHGDASQDPDLYRSLCRGCPVAQACLDDAMRREAGMPARARYGIWGGMTMKDRASLASSSGDEFLRSCETCGEAMTRSGGESWTKYRRRRYCSSECRAAGRAQNIAANSLGTDKEVS